MTKSMKPAVIRSPTWWKKRSSLERGLVVAAICAVLIIAGLAVAIGNVATKNICFTPECIQAASSILENMDESVEPCDNFYKFACGNFLKKTVIPDDKTWISSFSTMRDNLLQKLRSSFEEDYQPSDPRHFRLVKQLYKTCMNTTAIEEQGLTPLVKRLKDLGGYPVLEGHGWNEDGFNWKKSVYKFRKMGESVGYFMNFFIDIDAKNSTKRIITVDQPYLGLPRKYLIKGLTNKLVSAYYDYMVDIAVLLGADKEQAAKELKESLEFEIKLANITLPSEKRRNEIELYNPMTVREMSLRFPGIPWMEYFNTLLSPVARVTENDMVNVAVPRFITDLVRLLEQVPKRDQANYIMRRVAAGVAGLFNEEIRKLQLAYDTVVIGKTKREPRWKECSSVVSGHLPLSVGALYVKKYFNEDAKQKAAEMITDIKEQFVKILKTVDWMDDETRKAALDKAESMSTYIAYPDELLDDNKMNEFYQRLQIIPSSYVQSMQSISLFYTEYSYKKLHEPVNKSDWINHAMPAVANAYYTSFDNSIEIPAGILQETRYNKKRPNYINYGAIGMIVGHEITHGFDDEGRQYDKNGNLIDWWAPETKEKYLKKAECIISQYGNYTAAEVNLNLNGINTQGENIADNGGIKQVYLAYNEWVRRNGAEPRLPGLNYNSQQMFWISVANAWCSKDRPEALRMYITVGAHSPEEFRVIGPMSNMPEFARDFNCPIGSPMNPEKKCVVW